MFSLKLNPVDLVFPEKKLEFEEEFLKKVFDPAEISGDYFEPEEIAAENCGYFLEESLDVEGKSVDLNFPAEKLELRIISYKNIEENLILCSKLFVTWSDSSFSLTPVEAGKQLGGVKKTVSSFLNVYRDAPTSGKLFLYRRQLYLWTPSDGDSHMTSTGPSFRKIRCEKEGISFEDGSLGFTSGKKKFDFVPLLVDRTSEQESLICLEENEQSSSLTFVRIGALGEKNQLQAVEFFCAQTNSTKNQLQAVEFFCAQTNSTKNQFQAEVLFRSSEYRIKRWEFQYVEKDNFALDENGFFYFKLGSPEKALKLLAPDFREVYTYPLENYRLWNLFSGERKLSPQRSGREDLNVYLEKQGEIFALERKIIDTR